MDFREVGRHVPRTKWSVGWVEKRGKRRKVWVGFWYEYFLVGDTERRRIREKVLAVRAPWQDCAKSAVS